MGRLRAILPATLTTLLLATLGAASLPTQIQLDPVGWRPAGGLAAPRAYASAIALPTGEILVVGGLDRDDPHLVRAGSEVYDPLSSHTRVLDRPFVGRVNNSATVARNGHVVIAGGSQWSGDKTGWVVVDSVDVYLTYEHRWIAGAPMLQPRTGGRATALRDGRVFVTGGYDGPRLIGTSEIYDPLVNRWDPAAPMPRPRGDFAITTLPDGRVLVAGGLDGKDSIETRSSLFYDPKTDRWSDGPQLTSPRVLQAQAKLPNGDLLIVGGQGYPSGTAERYDVRRNTFVFAGTLSTPRMVAQAAALPDGRVVVTGGLPVLPGPRLFTPTGASELWDPVTNSWNDIPPVSSPRAFAGLVAVSGGVFQISGAAKDDRAEASVERFVWH
jgi:N-acetylneuraminic acid mutarotase